MREVNYRGLSKAVYAILAKHPNKVFAPEAVTAQLNGAYRDAPQRSVTGALKYLHGNGQAERVGYGAYRLAPDQAAESDPVAIIDQLLDAMAAAEPILRKAKAVMGALREVQ
jgi:hypothetical protein